MAKNLQTKVKENIKRLLLKKTLKKEMDKIRKKYGYCIIFIAVPVHGNLGDQAIVYSQYKLFESIGLKNNIVEIRSCDYERFADTIEELIVDKDMIIIDGGGNMGTLWIKEEYKMRDIVSRFKNNKIIIFPETVYYSNDDFGRLELEKSKSIYTSHDNLYICVRDNYSYELLKKEYKSLHIEYTPDIVLFLNDLPIKNERKDAIFCIRKDKEGILDSEATKALQKSVINKGLSIKYSSTLIDRAVTKKTREKELFKKWNEFSTAKIIITDRLHGMIFATITNTPCIALNNSSKKVEGVYQWIKELPYIIFCDDFRNIEESIDRLLNMQVGSYSEYTKDKLMNSFAPIIKIVKDENI